VIETQTAAGEWLRRFAVTPHVQPTAVVLDLMHPTRSAGRLGGKGGNAGFHESFGISSARRHAGAMTASSDP
jgi:hypothetical protein